MFLFKHSGFPHDYLTIRGLAPITECFSHSCWDPVDEEITFHTPPQVQEEKHVLHIWKGDELKGIDGITPLLQFGLFGFCAIDVEAW